MWGHRVLKVHRVVKASLGQVVRPGHRGDRIIRVQAADR
jgi:hypothetical protein